MVPLSRAASAPRSLAAGVLDEVLAPLSMHAQVNLLQRLARMGRAEGIEAAARLATHAEIEGFHRLGLGEVLTRCQDSRGAIMLEALYRRSVDRRSFDKDTVVPCDWITEDLLSEEIGTIAARQLRAKLLALGRALPA